MISRLTIFAALLNLVLAGYIVYNIFDMQEEVKNYKPEPITLNQKNNIDKNQQATLEPKKEESPTGDSNSVFDELTDKKEKDKFKNYNLSDEELYQLLNSGNPFGTSLQNDSSSLKEKIDKQVEDDVKLEDTKETGEQKIVEEEAVKEVSELKAKKYDIPKEWIIAVIENSSDYTSDLVTNDDGVTRKGIMQIREDKISFISESIGAFYQPNLELEVDSNIEMGAYYLSYLSNQNTDKHYPFTAYYLGPTEAKKIFEETGSYQSEFSQAILSKIKES